MSSLRVPLLCLSVFVATGSPAAQSRPAPAGDAALIADGPALLREWVPPVYPPEQLKQKASGMVTVRLIVDETGAVTSARAMEESDAAFVEPAVAAVKAWRFKPATDNQRPVACCLETLVAFSPARGQQKPSVVPPQDQTFSLPPRSSPEPRNSPSGDYPAVLVERKLPGAVLFACRVSAEGRAIAPQVLAATHPEFVLPALQALELWEFKPGLLGDLPVEAEVEAKMTFDALFDTPADIFAANGITSPDGSAPAITPEPLVVVDPAWPVERLLAGEGGSATVEFEVTRAGLVRQVRIRDASQPEFGYALAAAVETWRFNRIIGGSDAEFVALTKRANVAPIAIDAADASGPDARLVLALRRGEIGFAKGLDERLTPLYRVSPAYPKSLLVEGSGPAGRAEIEFVIDREGRARLPRIAAATHPEFGWAAATALGQWLFKAPRRGGQPVDVKVRIPFEFKLPAAQ